MCTSVTVFIYFVAFLDIDMYLYVVSFFLITLGVKFKVQLQVGTSKCLMLIPLQAINQ